MGIPLVEGRVFDARDRLSSPRVVVVNQSFARRYFPKGRALGHRILVQVTESGPGGDRRDRRRHPSQRTDQRSAPTVFLLHAQTPGYITNLVVRTRGSRALRRCHPPRDP